MHIREFDNEARRNEFGPFKRECQFFLVLCLSVSGPHDGPHRVPDVLVALPGAALRELESAAQRFARCDTFAPFAPDDRGGRAGAEFGRQGYHALVG